MGAVFIPTLEEGDLAMQMTVKPGSSLSESIRTSTKAEKVLLENFPEIEHVVSKIGTAEVPTDPMAIEDADIMIILKEKENWTSASNRVDLVEKMKTKLEVIAGASFEFTQPIQLRFNELMTGAKTDIAVKIFGENTETLKDLGDQTAKIVENIPGAADVKVEQTEGLPQMVIQFNREKIAQYGLNIQDLNTLVRTAYAGETAGFIFENERKFDLVVRFNEENRTNLDLQKLYIPLPGGNQIPLSELAVAEYVEGPMQISRESARRFIGIGINVRNRDVASLVAAIESALNEQLVLPPGYSITYGGEFENLRKAQQRLTLAVPAALFLILALLFFAFGNLKYALIIFTAVPLAAVGGVIALWLRGMPFSISAGVGFIALFGVAVLNGIVLISYFNRLQEEGMTELTALIMEGGITRLRPVIMTATTTAFGFLPMALSTSNGAEVQKPLATVVIGGLITATILTLIVLPVLYYLISKKRFQQGLTKTATILLLVLAFSPGLSAQSQELTLNLALENARNEHPLLKNTQLNIQQAQLGIDQAKQIPATNFNLQFGQMNTTLIDYQFIFNQSIGNPAANKQRKMVAQSAIAVSETEARLTLHQLEMTIKYAWNDWMYQQERVQLFEQRQTILLTLLEKTQVRYNTGEIGRLELTLAENRRTQNDQALEDAALSERNAYRRLLNIAYLQGSYTVPVQDYIALPLPDSSTFSEVWTQPFEKELELARAETRLQRKLLSPEYSFGYFNQSIRPEYSLQGIAGGIAIPLWQKAMRANIEEHQLQEIVAQNNLELQQWNLQQTQIAAWQAVVSKRRQLDEFGETMNDQRELIAELSRRQWENGEIEYFYYLQSQNEALQNELNYLEMIYQYNQSVLDWEKWRR